MIDRSLLLCFLLNVSGFTSALEVSSFSTGISLSSSNGSALAPSTKFSLASPSYIISIPSIVSSGQLPPDSNSRGDYITTICTTQHPTYTVGPGYTVTEPFGNGIFLVGPTTWVTQDVLTFAEVANDATTTSSAAQIWDPNPFFSGENKTIVTGKASFISYGREAACTSAFNSYASANPSTIYTEKSPVTITLSNGQTTVAVAYSTQTLPMTGAPHCCGTCSLYFNNLQMLYWLAPHPNTACLESKSVDLRNTSTTGSIATRGQSVYATDSDGYVYTSPSIYVRFPTVSASDACGLIGSASTSITLAFAPGELSTFVWELFQGTSTQTFTSALDTADLPCGPWNGTDKFLPEAYSNYSSYQPLIVLPSKLVDLVPAWKSCTADMFEGQDPPRALSPAAAMAPAPTMADTHTKGIVASPSPSIPALPVKTGAGNAQHGDPNPTSNSPSKANDPSTDHPGDSSNGDSPPKPNEPSTVDPGSSSNHDMQSNPNGPSTEDPGDAKNPADNAGLPIASPASDTTQNTADNRPANGVSSPSATEYNDAKKIPLAFPTAVALQGHIITEDASPITIAKTPVAYQSGTISVGNELQAVPAGWGWNNEDPSPVTVGGLVFSAISSASKADSDPQNGKGNTGNSAQINHPAADSSDPATYITVRSQTIAVDANAISVAGTILKPEDPGVTVDGTPISLGSSFFVVGSRTESLSLPQATMTAPPLAITVGGHTISFGSSAIIMDGTTLRPADPGITVDGTLVSLGSSILVVGSHTEKFVLPQVTPTPAPSYLTLGGETIVVAASSVIVAGHTMTPAGPAVMADGTLVSLGSSVLVVGTRTMSFTLPTVSAAVITSEGIGAMIMKGLGGIGAGIVTSPTPAAATYNGTRGGNRTVVFMGGAKNDDSPFKGWAAWLWTALLFAFY